MKLKHIAVSKIFFRLNGSVYLTNMSANSKKFLQGLMNSKIPIYDWSVIKIVDYRNSYTAILFSIFGEAA